MSKKNKNNKFTRKNWRANQSPKLPKDQWGKSLQSLDNLMVFENTAVSLQYNSKYM